MEKIISIDIYGQNFKFKAESEIGNVNQIEKIVKDEVAKAVDGLIKGKGGGNTFIAVMVAALNIASEFIEINCLKQAMIGDLEQKINSLNLAISSSKIVSSIL
ncbi:MAG: cell division protein ZapA [Desulfobacterales bacterium]|nr:cell division protein ZapA [Desulfobacterales bacterium]